MLGCGETKFVDLLRYLYKHNLNIVYSKHIKNSLMPIQNGERITENNFVLYTHLKTRLLQESWLFLKMKMVSS